MYCISDEARAKKGASCYSAISVNFVFNGQRYGNGKNATIIGTVDRYNKSIQSFI